MRLVTLAFAHATSTAAPLGSTHIKQNPPAPSTVEQQLPHMPSQHPSRDTRQSSGVSKAQTNTPPTSSARSESMNKGPQPQIPMYSSPRSIARPKIARKRTHPPSSSSQSATSDPSLASVNPSKERAPMLQEHILQILEREQAYWTKKRTSSTASASSSVFADINDLTQKELPSRQYMLEELKTPSKDLETILLWMMKRDPNTTWTMPSFKKYAEDAETCISSALKYQSLQQQSSVNYWSNGISVDTPEAIIRQLQGEVLLLKLLPKIRQDRAEVQEALLELQTCKDVAYLERVRTLIAKKRAHMDKINRSAIIRQALSIC